MKKIILSLLVLVIILICLPFFDGYFFKKVYLQHIAYFQQELMMQGNQKLPPAELTIVSYDRGWFKSTAHLTLTQTISSTLHGGHPTPFLVLHIDTVIHHGPLVFIDHQPKLAYAFMETQLNAPDFMKMFSHQNPIELMQIKTLVSLNGNTWKNNCVIQPISTKIAQWDGMSGDVNLTMNKGSFPVNIDSTMLFGKIYVSPLIPILPEITVQPITGTGKISQASFSNWNMSSTLKLPRVSAKWQDGSLFDMKNMKLDFQSGARNQLYHDEVTLSVADVQLPFTLPVSSLSALNATLSIKDITLTDIDTVMIGENDALLKILSPTANMNITFNTETNLGSATGNVSASLLAMPQTSDQIKNYLNVILTARVSQSLIHRLLSDTLINLLLQQGVMLQDKSDYIISYNRKGLENNLNGKILSDNDLIQLKTTIQNTIKPPTPFAPTMTSTLQPMPTALPNGHCYWMDSHTGKNIWISTPIQTKADCFRMDSCSGGLKESGGGCYKWAASPDGTAESWR